MTSRFGELLAAGIIIIVLDEKICLLQSAAVWHVLAVRSVSSLGEYSLEGGEYVFMCARCVTCMLRAGVEVVSEVVYREALAGAFVMFELGEVRDGQPQVLAVVGGPVLMHFLSLKPSEVIREARVVT